MALREYGNVDFTAKPEGDSRAKVVSDPPGRLREAPYPRDLTLLS